MKINFSSFQHPDNSFRPAPFWAINDRLTPEETARQMADMIGVGFSGGFFHSRTGLITDYMGEEWFRAMDAALEVAHDQDGYLWLYDEDLWPSGNAGGQVAAMNEEYRAATLRAQLLSPGEVPVCNEDCVLRAAYFVTLQGVTLTSILPITLEEAVSRTDVERLVFLRCYAPKTGRWNGESYANLLHPEVAQQFMRLTHEVYRQKYGDEFGKRVPGIFTDEPQLGRGPFDIPWYEGLPEQYMKWSGRDIWADLPLLYFDTPDSRKARLLVHRCILRQFCEAYDRPIFDWCTQNGMTLTGHYADEDALIWQIRIHAGGVMAHYRYQHIPGVDHIIRRTTPLLLALKQVSSAAHQLGRQRVLTEIFGVSRHTNTFQDFKWVGDYDLVLGANLFCPHLTLYSARGRCKRDFPPNWNYQQTYWHDLRPLNDYITRVSYALTCGDPQVEVLLLHPIENATAGRRIGVQSKLSMPGEDMSAAEHGNRMLCRALEAILNAGYDCDVGDEGYLADMGSVDGRDFCVGQMRYRVVVAPPAQTWRPSTYALLREFINNGGPVIFLGDLPTELDTEPAEDTWRELAQSATVAPCATVQIQHAIERTVSATYLLRTAEGSPAPQTYVQHRVDGEQEIFFVVNADRDKGGSYVLTLFDRAGETVSVWNPLDGSRSRASVQVVEQALIYSFVLPPAGSQLIVVSKDACEDLSVATVQPDLLPGTIHPLPTAWEFHRSEENVLVMDRIGVSVDGGNSWWESDLDFNVRLRLARHFGVENALEWQPWVAIQKRLFEGKGGEVILKYQFHSAIVPKCAFLVLEDMKKGDVTVNNLPIDTNQATWHWDRGFGKADITPMIQVGLNTVEYRVAYDFLTEVEPAYIVGDFGVRLCTMYEGEIVNEPALLNSGSWADQGYPFYSGSMTYRCDLNLETQKGARLFLRLLNASGILYHVRMNGEMVGSILWHPTVLELTDSVKEGTNTLEIDVVSSRQNTFGPLHEKEGEDNWWCTPSAFESSEFVHRHLTLFDYGLLGGAEIVTLP